MFIYPENLKAKPMLWLWELRDIGIIGVGFLLSVLALSQGAGMISCIPKAEHLYRSEMGKTAGQTRRKGTHTKLRGYGADRIQAAFYERDFFPGRHERVRKSVEFLCASHI